MKDADELASKYNSPTRMSFHQALLEDFFGLTKSKMLARGLYFIGWGFSYQAFKPQTKSVVCDFEFSSSTINAGDLFDDQPNLNTIEHGNRRLKDKLGNFFRVGFNYMRAFDTRKVNVKLIRMFDAYYSKQTNQYLPQCPSKQRNYQPKTYSRNRNSVPTPKRTNNRWG